MAQYVIPTSTDPEYRQTTALDGTSYVLAFAFSARENVWYLSILTPSGTTLAAGIKLMANRGLLGRRANPGLPPGDLLVYTDSSDESPPGIDELGIGLRCTLVYVDAAELAAL